MANEIKVSVTLDVNDTGTGSARLLREYLNLTFDMSGARILTNIQNIGTSSEAIDLGDIGTLGMAVFKNLDATNSITIRSGSGGGDVVKLNPGEVALFRLATVAPFAIASLGTCNLEYAIVED